MEGVRKSAMSYEELKSKLLQRFQSQGVFQEMKAQMRSKLVQELYQTLPYLGRDSPDGDERGMLPAQVSNWLVYDHLQREKYEFTLSTFLQESGMVKSPKKILGTRDVLYLLGVSEHLTKDMYATEHEGGQSFLFTVVKQAMATQVRNSKVAGGTQTWREQLRLIDETFEKQKIVKTKEENEYQVVIKEVEELRNHIDQELKKSRVLQQRAYPVESQSRQHSASNRKSVQPQNLESTAVGELPLLSQPFENDLLRQKDHFNQTVEQRIKVIEDDIRKKWVVKEQQLQAWEEQLMLKANRLEQDKIKDHVQESDVRLQEEKLKVEQLYNQQRMVQNENQSLKKTLEEMADYKILKSELALAKKEAKMCHDRLESSQREWMTIREELEKTIAELTIKLTNPCSQLLKAHQEIKKLQDMYRLDNSVWNKQHNDLEKELQEIKQLYQRTLLRNEGQRHQLESQELTVKTLKQQLQEVQLAMVEKEHIITRMNSHSYSFGPSNFQQSTEHIPGYHDLSPDYFLARMDTLSFLTETKKRIESMQAEGEMLEKRYRHVIDAPAFSLNPPRSLRLPFGSTPNLGPSLQDNSKPARLGSVGYHDYETRVFQTEAAGFDYTRGSFSELDDSIHFPKSTKKDDLDSGEHAQENGSRVVRRLESKLLHRDPNLRASLPILTESPSLDREREHLRSGLYKPQSLISLPSKQNIPVEHSLDRTHHESAIDITSKNNIIPNVIVSRTTASEEDLSVSQSSAIVSLNEAKDSGKKPNDQELSAIEHSPKLLTLPTHLAVKEKHESHNKLEKLLKSHVNNSNENGSNVNNATRSKANAKLFLNEVLHLGQRKEAQGVGHFQNCGAYCR